MNRQGFYITGQLGVLCAAPSPQHLVHPHTSPLAPLPDVQARTVPGPEHLVTEATGNGNPLQVVRFYVIPDNVPFCLLATHSADMSSALFSSTCDQLLTFDYKRGDFFIKTESFA